MGNMMTLSGKTRIPVEFCMTFVKVVVIMQATPVFKHRCTGRFDPNKLREVPLEAEILSDTIPRVFADGSIMLRSLGLFMPKSAEAAVWASSLTT